MFTAFGLAVASEGFLLTQLRTELTAENATLTLGQIVAPRALAAPHLVRRFAPSTHGYVLMVSAAMGGVLLLAADLLARDVIAPQELPVGVLTAILGGGYLLWLLHRRKFS